MTADTISIMGIFSSERRAASAIDGLRETPWTIERVHSPIPSHDIEHALEPPKSRVGWFTLAGGIIGFFTGFFLAAFTAARWSLIVGGKPVVALADNLGQQQYFLAAMADKIWLNPKGMVWIDGFFVRWPQKVVT